MNQPSVIYTMAFLLLMFSILMLITKNPQTSDTLGKLAFGTLTATAAYLQHKD